MQRRNRSTEEDVAGTGMYFTDNARCEEAGRAHGEFLATRPVIAAAADRLIAPDLRVDDEPAATGAADVA